MTNAFSWTLRDFAIYLLKSIKFVIFLVRSIFNLDINFYFFIIIELSIKPSRDPTASTPLPRNPDLGCDLRLGITSQRGWGKSHNSRWPYQNLNRIPTEYVPRSWQPLRFAVAVLCLYTFECSQKEVEKTIHRKRRHAGFIKRPLILLQCSALVRHFPAIRTQHLLCRQCSLPLVPHFVVVFRSVQPVRERSKTVLAFAGNWVTPGAVVADVLTTRLGYWSWWSEKLAVYEGYVIQQVWAVLFSTAVPLLCRSQWPSSLRRRSAVDRLLVRIPPGSWMCVLCECCVLPGRGRCDGPIPRPEESYRLWCVILCDLDPSRMRRPWPALSCCSRQKVSTNTLRSRRHKWGIYHIKNKLFCSLLIPVRVLCYQPLAALLSSLSSLNLIQLCMVLTMTYHLQ